MELQGLIDLCRQRADDAVAPYHVTDEALAGFASEAEREAATRARLIRDTTTPYYTSYPILVDTQTYELDPIINAIDSAVFFPTGSARGSKVTLCGMDKIEDNCDWTNRTAREPCSLVHLETPNSFYLWPRPSAAGTLQLAVYRNPILDLEDPDDEPEIPYTHHDGLVAWMLYRVYSTKDSELEDPSRASAAYTEFESRFGPRPTADVLRRHRERRRYTTKYGGL